MNASGGVPVKMSSGSRPQHARGEGIGGGQHFAVEVHRRLGPAGGPRGERDHRHVVGGGRHRAERARLPGGPLDQVVVGVAAVADDPQPRHARGGQLGGETVIAERQVHPGDAADRGQFAGPQQGHRGDHDPARLDHAQPAGRQPGVVRAAQQHPVPGHHAQLIGEHPGHLVGAAQQVAVAPGLALRQQARPVRAAGRHRLVEQRLGAIEPVRVVQVRQRELQVGQQVSRRQAVPAERVNVRGWRELHGRTSTCATRDVISIPAG